MRMIARDSQQQQPKPKPQPTLQSLANVVAAVVVVVANVDGHWPFC